MTASTASAVRTDRHSVRPVDFSTIRGFNYEGSWGSSGLDLWAHHDRRRLRQEIARGKKYFPGWNGVRWWLSHDAFVRDPRQFLTDFDDGLEVFAAHGIAVEPVLFNRWRDAIGEYGGVLLEQIVPGLEISADEHLFDELGPGRGGRNVQPVFYDYLTQVVGEHAHDERIFSWDLVNEPLSGVYAFDPDSPVLAAEMKWLDWTARVVRSTGTEQPLTIGMRLLMHLLKLTEPLVDVISFHPYFIPGLHSAVSQPEFREALNALGDPARFGGLLDEVVAFGTSVGKPVFANEGVLGAIDDEAHAKLIDFTLGRLQQRGIGFLAHALHHSLVADLHSAVWGPVGPGGRFEFINEDGSLRRGHEVFNRYAPGSADRSRTE